VKVARTVLRGESGGNAADLLDIFIYLLGLWDTELPLHNGTEMGEKL